MATNKKKKRSRIEKMRRDKMEERGGCEKRDIQCRTEK